MEQGYRSFYDPFFHFVMNLKVFILFFFLFACEKDVESGSSDNISSDVVHKSLKVADLCNLRSKYLYFPFRVPHLQVQKERKKGKKRKEGKKKKKCNFYVET